MIQDPEPITNAIVVQDQDPEPITNARVVQDQEPSTHEIDLLISELEFRENCDNSASIVPKNFPIIKEIEMLDVNGTDILFVPDISSKQVTMSANGTDDLSISESTSEQDMISVETGVALADMSDYDYKCAAPEASDKNNCDIKSKGDAYLPNQLTFF